MGKQTLLTTDRQEFLAYEYKHVFYNVFKTPEDFEMKMQEYIKQCITCGSYHWLSEKKRCDCDYQTRIPGSGRGNG